MSVNFCWRFPYLLLGKTICVLYDNSLKLLKYKSLEDAKIHMCSAYLSIQPELTLFHSFFYTFGCVYFFRWTCMNKSCIMYKMRFRKVCSGQTGHKFKMLWWTYWNFFLDWSIKHVHYLHYKVNVFTYKLYHSFSVWGSWLLTDDCLFLDGISLVEGKVI